MQAIAEEGQTSPGIASRRILVAIDDNYACERALEWAMREFYRFTFLKGRMHI